MAGAEMETKCVTGDLDVRVRTDSTDSSNLNYLLVDINANSNMSTNPDFGGGSSDRSGGAVPAKPVLSTPPKLSHGGTAQHERKSLPNLPTPIHSTPRRRRTISTSSSTCDIPTQTPY